MSVVLPLGEEKETRSKDVGFIYHSRQLVAPLSQFYVLRLDRNQR